MFCALLTCLPLFSGHFVPVWLRELFQAYLELSLLQSWQESFLQGTQILLVEGSAQPLGGGPPSAQVCLPVVGWSPTTSTLPSGFLREGRKEAIKFFFFFFFQRQVKVGAGRRKKMTICIFYTFSPGSDLPNTRSDLLWSVRFLKWLHSMWMKMKLHFI